ncbi:MULTISPECIES: PspC domain-containing protein [unclassified Paenibacillus]|uniref:PspC domain-containing protein n=1 Tax=Paenibacillus sp. BK720 TaxID=2587092 RepID=UPI00104522AA|nr:phage shock protein PspC (stress-responsive transcriptional regulator) [Paenibacillus sp. BK720]TCN01923.1 phage shock protein C (PspC) family protein [Paenibacillus sp. BK033]
MKKKLTRSLLNKSIAGVCGGIAEYCNLSPLYVRLLFLLFIPCNLIVYIILANVIPASSPTLYRR